MKIKQEKYRMKKKKNFSPNFKLKNNNSLSSKLDHHRKKVCVVGAGIEKELLLSECFSHPHTI